MRVASCLQRLHKHTGKLVNIKWGSLCQIAWVVRHYSEGGKIEKLQKIKGVTIWWIFMHWRLRDDYMKWNFMHWRLRANIRWIFMHGWLRNNYTRQIFMHWRLRCDCVRWILVWGDFLCIEGRILSTHTQGNESLIQTYLDSSWGQTDYHPPGMHREVDSFELG